MYYDNDSFIVLSSTSPLDSPEYCSSHSFHTHLDSSLLRSSGPLPRLAAAPGPTHTSTFNHRTVTTHLKNISGKGAAWGREQLVTFWDESQMSVSLTWPEDFLSWFHCNFRKRCALTGNYWLNFQADLDMFKDTGFFIFVFTLIMTKVHAPWVPFSC